MKKKIVLGLMAAGTAVAMVPLFAAFEAHVINVTAKIENALKVSAYELPFGTVFPQEKLDKTFNVELSTSFMESGQVRADDVEYVIRQKPKCVDNQNPSLHPQVTEDANGVFHCPSGSTMMPLLCPYLSKHEITTDPATGQENDSAGIGAFHGPLTGWDMDDTEDTEVEGKLIKSAGDILDTWNIDFKVPFFKCKCAQDWDAFVKTESGDPSIDSEAYKSDPLLEHAVYGCDLWLEVTKV